MNSNAAGDISPRWYDQWMEFTLVIVLLVFLCLLVLLILNSPLPQLGSGPDSVAGKDVLAYRSGLMTALLGTFGAWIGAGAAYFFGSKNLKRTTDALQRVQLTGQQRLSSVKLNEMDPAPQPIKTKVHVGDPLKSIEALLDDPKEWWFAVINDNETLNTVLHEESYYRFYIHELDAGKVTSKKEFQELTVSTLVDWVKGQPNWNWVLYSIFVPASMTMTAAAVNEAMMAKGVHVAIVLNDENKPTHYVTDGEIKRALENC